MQGRRPLSDEDQSAMRQQLAGLGMHAEAGVAPDAGARIDSVPLESKLADCSVPELKL